MGHLADSSEAIARLDTAKHLPSLASTEWHPLPPLPTLTLWVEEGAHQQRSGATGDPIALFDEIDITGVTLAEIGRRGSDAAVASNLDLTVEFREVALASARSGRCPVGSAVLSVGAPRKTPWVVTIAEQDGIAIRMVSLVSLRVNDQDGAAGERILAALHLTTAGHSGVINLVALYHQGTRRDG